MAFKWKKRYEVGVDIIDSRHKEIFDRSHQLLEACQNQRGEDEIEKALKFLADYIKDHFAEEEEVQQKYDYPDYERHKKLHEKFVAQVEEFREDFYNDNISTVDLMKLHKVITRWFVNHIKKEDLRIAEHIKSQEE